MADIGLRELDRACAFREFFLLLATQELVHEIAEDAIARDPGRHRFFIAIADPDRNGDLRRDAAEPLVAVVFTRAGLAANRLSVIERRVAARALLNNALHDFDRCLRKIGIEHLIATRVGVIDDLTRRVLDLLDAVRLVQRAAVSDGRIGLSHLEHTYLFNTERDGRNALEIRFDTALVCHISNLIGADLGTEFRKAGVR